MTLSLVAKKRQEESPGNAEPPYFLTGRYTEGNDCITASATENKPLSIGQQG